MNPLKFLQKSPDQKKTKQTPQKHSERGQAIILIVFAMIGLIGIIALAVDGGNAFLQKRDAQNAADTIALSAALARIKGFQAEWVNQSYEVAKANGYEYENWAKNVQIYSPPITGRYVGDVEYIQVLIIARVPTYFGTVIGIERITVTAEAISRTKVSELTQILDGNAVVSLAPTSDCLDKRAFWIHGESTLKITGGGILINSNNPDCALIQNGNGSIRLEENSEIKMVGGADIKKPQLITPFPPHTGGTSIPYPPPFFMPEIGCSKDAEILEDGETLSSGAWSDGVFPPLGVHYLQAGAYCIEGVDFHVKGGDNFLEGINIVIQVEGGRIHLDAGAKVNLKAPLQGDLAGLLIYVPMENHFPVTINLGPESSIKGTILAPGAEIRMNNDDSAGGLHSQIIGYMIRSDGQSIIKIKYKDEDNYDAYTMPEIQLIK